MENRYLNYKNEEIFYDLEDAYSFIDYEGDVKYYRLDYENERFGKPRTLYIVHYMTYEEAEEEEEE